MSDSRSTAMFDLDTMETMLMLPFLGTMLVIAILVTAAMLWGARSWPQEPAE
jgi:hypothetical protein